MLPEMPGTTTGEAMTIPTVFRKQLIRLEGAAAKIRNEHENAASRARLKV